MSEADSKNVFVYRQVRRALRSGRYLPGQRIDPNALAADFGISPTPVRHALYRLVGEGLLADHARSGLYVPLPTEVALRDRYDLMERLLLIACDIGPAPTAQPRDAATTPDTPDGDVVQATWKLFDAIARATGHRELYDVIRRTNDRLAPVRRAKRALIDDAAEEHRALSAHWHARNLRALRSALQGYHGRRRQLVPHIVATLNEQCDRTHRA